MTRRYNFLSTSTSKLMTMDRKMISDSKESITIHHSGKNRDRFKNLWDISYRCFFFVLAVLVCGCLMKLCQQETVVRSLVVRFDKTNDTLAYLTSTLDGGREVTNSTDLPTGTFSNLMKEAIRPRVKRASGTENPKRKGRKRKTGKGKKRSKPTKERAIGQAFVLQNEMGPDKLVCWKEDANVVKWARSVAGNVQIRTRGQYLLTLQLSLMLKPQTCLHRRSSPPSVGYAVYLRKKRNSLETKILRCITATTCTPGDITTCTSNRLVEMEKWDEVVVKMQGLLAHRTLVRVEPYFTSLSLVRVLR